MNRQKLEGPLEGEDFWDGQRQEPIRRPLSTIAQSNRSKPVRKVMIRRSNPIQLSNRNGNLGSSSQRHPTNPEPNMSTVRLQEPTVYDYLEPDDDQFFADIHVEREEVVGVEDYTGDSKGRSDKEQFGLTNPSDRTCLIEKYPTEFSKDQEYSREEWKEYEGSGRKIQTGRKRKIRIGAEYSEYDHGDIIQFLQLVNDENPIWDVTSSSYHRKEVRQKCFDDVEKNCGIVMPRGKPHGRNAQVVWESLLRDFTKEWRRQECAPSGSGNVRYGVIIPSLHGNPLSASKNGYIPISEPGRARHPAICLAFSISFGSGPFG